MTDAPECIALRWEPGAAVTSGPLMMHPDYTRYIRADATFTADDLRRAFAIAIEMAAEQMQAWANGVAASDYPQAAKVVPTLVATTIKVFANMPPPDDLAARVKEGRDA